MSLQYHVLTKSSPVTTVTVGVRSAPAPFPDYTLTQLIFSIGAALSGPVTFDFRVNGVSVFAPGARPTIPAGQRSVTVSGLSVGGSLSDILSWDVTALPLGGIPAPVTCTAVLDDGVSAGGSLEVAEADTSPDISTVTKLVVGNGDLTDLGGGHARLKTASDVSIPTSLPPSGAAGGDLAGTYPNPVLANLGLTPAAYGDATHIPVVTVDAKGRVTAISVVAVSGGGGSPGGDLSGADLAHAVVTGLRTIPVKAFGSSTTLHDDFNDGVFDTSLWGRDDSTQVTESGGTMNLTAVHNANWAAAHNMTNHSVQAHLMPSGGGTLFFRLVLDTGVDYIECRLSPNSGFTRLGRHSPGAGDEWTVATSYDSTNDAWLKVAHQSSDNTWHFYTSPDGAAWTDRGNCSPPSGATCAAAILYIYCIGGTLSVDDFNSTVPDTGASLADGDVLTYNGTSGQFENRIPGQVHIITNLTETSPAPTNLLPGQSALGVDLVNHRMGFWNPNIGKWDWKTANNS